MVYKVKKGKQKLENSNFFVFNFYMLSYSAMEDQASFRVKYDFSGPQYQKYHQLYKKLTEPIVI